MKRATEYLFFIFVVFFLVFLYRQVIFNGKIAFPSNYLAHFYAPYSQEKFPGWEQGIPHKPIGADQIRFFYPSKTLGFHYWNPYIFAGSPNLANFQSALFYPFNWLYFILPQITVWNILVIIQPILASIFTFLFLRSLNLSKLSSAFGAFCFGFSGYMITWTQENSVVGQASLWLPLIFYGIEKRFSVAVFAWVMSFLAGYFQSTFYVTVFSGAYFLYRNKTITGNKLLIVLAGILAVIPQFLPSLQAFLLSPRPSVNIAQVFNTYQMPLTYLLNLLSPDIFGNPGSYNMFKTWSYNETSLYIGSAAILVAILGFTKNKFFAITAVLTYLTTTNGLITKLPLLSTFQPTRIFLITTFCLSVLAAFGIENLKMKSLRKISLGAILLLGLIAIYYYFQPAFPPRLVALKNLILPAGLVMATLGFSFLPTRLFIVGIFGLTIFSQYYFFNKYLVVGEKQFLYPSHPIFEFMKGKADRYVAIDENIFGNIPAQFKTYSPEGFDPIFPVRYGQLAYAVKNGGVLTDQIPRIEVTLSELDRTKNETMASNSARLKLLSLLGTKYFFSPNPQDIFDPKLFKPIGKFGNWYGFENLSVLPRVFLANNFMVETDPQKTLNLILNPQTNLRETVILEEPINFFENPASGSAEFIKYDPEQVVIKTKSEGQKILFISDNYYPNWKAFIDGQATKIYRANFTFRAIVVSPGEHIINMSYSLL